MRKTIIFTVLCVLLSNLLQSQSNLPSLKSLEDKSIKHLKINKMYEKQADINKIFDGNAIFGISISGQIKFIDNSGFIKVVMVSTDSTEYLVFEGSR